MSFLKTGIVFRAVILPRKGGSCGGQSRDGNVSESRDAACHGIARHKYRPLGVYHRLYGHMAKGIQRIVKPNGKSDGYDVFKFFRIHTPGKKRKAKIRESLSDVCYAGQPG